MRITNLSANNGVDELPLAELTSRDIRIIDESLALYQRSIDELHLTDTQLGRQEYNEAQEIRTGLDCVRVSAKLSEEYKGREEPAHV